MGVIYKQLKVNNMKKEQTEAIVGMKNTYDQLDKLRNECFDKGDYNLSMELTNIISTFITDKCNLANYYCDKSYNEKVQLINKAYK